MNNDDCCDKAYINPVSARVTHTPVLPPPPENVVLTLPYEHARVLHAVVRRVGGHPSGMRGKVDDIVNALAGAQVSPVELPEHKRTGSITL
jgi:hypothetical protein